MTSRCKVTPLGAGSRNAVLRRQLDPTLQMLADIVDNCPPSSWLDSRLGRPFWQQGRGVIPDLDQDRKLLAASTLYDKCTYADLILGQVRHIQHHVGYCNCLLQSNGASPAKWMGFAEAR